MLECGNDNAFTANIEVWFQLLRECLQEVRSGIVHGAIQRGLSCLSVGCGGEKRVLGYLHGVLVESVELEDESVDFVPRLFRVVF